jgi:hypothetical protein
MSWVTGKLVCKLFGAVLFAIPVNIPDFTQFGEVRNWVFAREIGGKWSESVWKLAPEARPV